MGLLGFRVAIRRCRAWRLLCPSGARRGSENKLTTGCAMPAMPARTRAAIHPWRQACAPSGRGEDVSRVSRVSRVARCPRGRGRRSTRGDRPAPLRGEERMWSGSCRAAEGEESAVGGVEGAEGFAAVATDDDDVVEAGDAEETAEVLRGAEEGEGSAGGEGAGA